MILTPRAPASFISAAGGAVHPRLADNRLHGNSDVKSFILPNDDEEQHRLDNIQVMFKAYFGDTVIAPVPHDVHKVLDCGTGSGIVPGAESITSRDMGGGDSKTISYSRGTWNRYLACSQE